MHRRIKFGYRTKDNKQCPGVYNFEFHKKHFEDKDALTPTKVYIYFECIKPCSILISADLTQDMTLLDNMARDYQEQKGDYSYAELKEIDKKLDEFLPKEEETKFDLNLTKYYVPRPSSQMKNRRILLASKIREA